MNVGPQNPLSEQTHADKYRGEGESFREAMNRVASSLSDDQSHFKHLREALLHQRFMPAGRIQAAMGSTRVTTPYNCFVSGTIDDSFTEGSGSIMNRATEAAETMRRGGGIGYDFSTLRPKGDLIRKLQSNSSGPISFMEIFDAVCRCVASSGHRRGAQMGVLRIDHPDCEDFVHAKQNTDRLTGFNVSLALTDEFMNAVINGTPFTLRFNGQDYREIDARALWEAVMRSTWDWAEPGVLFIDRINEMNNLSYCETIAATNPCGEQPLPPFGACLLGSFNLTKYLIKNGESYQFDFERFRTDIPVVVRAMDNVVDRAIYPLREQEVEAHSKRRMGLGVTGVANAIEAILGEASYGSERFCGELERILRVLSNECYRASVELAKEKGSFPLFDADKYLQSPFVARLNTDVRESIAKHGIRNSHLTSIAPTGTISFCADNVSSGIEPVFSYSQERDLITPVGRETVTIEDYGFAQLGVNGKTTANVSVDEHLAVLEVAQRWVDSAVSKTCNVPSDMDWEQFKEVYVSAWKRGCKGVTTFNAGGKRMGILREAMEASEELSASDEEGSSACYVDPATGRRECE